MTITVSIHKKDDLLEKILSHISSGEEVIITQNDKPLARVIPIFPELVQRVPGSAKGQIVVESDFNEPLPKELLDAFES